MGVLLLLLTESGRSLTQYIAEREQRMRESDKLQMQKVDGYKYKGEWGALLYGTRGSSL